MLLMTWQYYSHKDSNLRRDVTFHKLATWPASMWVHTRNYLF
jgi:hypothetical protein